MKIGYIYRLTLLKDISSFKKGEVYIGQHFGDNDGYFSSGLLVGKVVNKHGIDIFRRDLLCVGIDDVDLLDLLEICLIDYYSCNRISTGYGLNLTDGGNRGLTRMVSCFDNSGKLIKTYDTITAAAIDKNLDIAYITRQCRGNKIYSAKGIRFRYYDPNMLSIEACILKLRTSKWIIVQQDEFGNTIKQFASIGLASLETGIKNKAIAGCLYSTSRFAGGYRWIRVKKKN